MVHSVDQRRCKLEMLAESEGFETVEAMLEAFALESVSPGICIQCDVTTEIKPDQAGGYCEVCTMQSVQSALVLAGII